MSHLVQSGNRFGSVLQVHSREAALARRRPVSDELRPLYLVEPTLASAQVAQVNDRLVSACVRRLASGQGQQPLQISHPLHLASDPTAPTNQAIGGTRRREVKEEPAAGRRGTWTEPGTPMA